MTPHLTTHSQHTTDTTADTDAGQAFEDSGFDLEEALQESSSDDSDNDVPSAELRSVGDMRAATDDLLEGLTLTPADTLLKGNSDDMSLDALLDESLKQASDSVAVKAGRKRLQDKRLPNRERLEIEAKIKEWELAREWLPAASVHIFNTQTCTNCGNVNATYAGLFQRQIHRSSKIMRWVLDVNGSGNNDGLPKEHKDALTEVPVCIECCATQGYGSVSPSI